MSSPLAVSVSWKRRTDELMTRAGVAFKVSTDQWIMVVEAVVAECARLSLQMSILGPEHAHTAAPLPADEYTEARARPHHSALT